MNVKKGIELIKRFEGCKLTAYKPLASEKYYTIGYGHYGADVRKGQKITQAQAEALLLTDVKKFKAKVDRYNAMYHFTENEYNALLSFCYNIGSLDGLTAHGTRTKKEIQKYLPYYNKAGGKELAGLTKRRLAELSLYCTK